MAKHLRAFLAPLLLFAPLTAQAQATSVPDTAQSEVIVDKATVKADSLSKAQVKVYVRDRNAKLLQYKKVTLSSDRGPLDTIVPPEAMTFSLGRAVFDVTSSKEGTATFSPLVDGQPLGKSVTVTFTPVLSIGLAPGDLVKIPDDGDTKTLNDTAVYYFANDGKRYVFPNENVYFTWFEDFSKVKVIPADQLALMPIGGNVTYRPGTKLVKFQTDVKTYLVTKGGVLRWVKTEDVAKALFGSTWNTKVDDISEAFYINYKFGDPVENPFDTPIDGIKATARTIDIDKGLTK